MAGAHHRNGAPAWKVPLGGCHQPEGWVSSDQKNTKEGAQPHSSADSWIKALLSKALPTRARPSFSHHQSLPSGSLYKRLSLLHQRADRRSKKNHSPTVTKIKTTLQKCLTSMLKQKVMSQMKGQDKTPEKQLNEVEIGHLPEKEFRIMIWKMIQDLRKRMEAKIERSKTFYQGPGRTKE